MGRSWSYAMVMIVAIILLFIPRGNVQDTSAQHRKPITAVTRQDPVKPSKPKSLHQAVSQRSVPAQISRETECLAKTVYFEARGEPLEGQLAVAQTVLNRTKSDLFPNSICAVVRQPAQFSFMQGQSFPAVDHKSKAWKKAITIALIAKEGWPGKARKALFFHARYVSPQWNRPRVARIGTHIFYL